jgi:hypothetical protein
VTLEIPAGVDYRDQLQPVEDPVETCFACYRQLFSEGILFSYDLASYYNDYRHLSDYWSDYWQERYPGHVFDLSYETLARESEAQIRRLLAFCDLPFDPACLTPHQTRREVLSVASAAQVREPIRTDTAHSAPYLQWLQSLRERLSK